MSSKTYHTSSSLSYRPEIEGLRAIAVISVILYHAQFIIAGRDRFEGGLIGVDVFFVISGYLITRIILSELKHSESFCFYTFYERRARRILPILFTVTCVTIPFSWHYFSAVDFIDFSETILASTLFGSNFYFYFSVTEYGGDSALLKPLLHSWSLGVEEQFYIIFPLIALIIFKFYRTHLLSIVLALVICSLQLSEILSKSNQDLSFYFPITRFWELGIGSILAVKELFYTNKENSFLKNILSIIGLFLIAQTILFYPKDILHPGYYTLIPVIGTALVISCATSNDFAGKILGNRPCIWIGKISYSAYLWHFPIFAIARYQSLTASNLEKVIWIALTLTLSVISYLIIEKPFRNKKTIKTKYFWIIIASLFTFLLTFSIASISGNISNQNKETYEGSKIAKLLDKSSFREENRDFEVNYDYQIKQNGKQNILVVGNSHAEDLLKALSYSYITQKYNLNLTSPLQRTKDINYQVKCLKDLLKDNITICDNIDFTEHLIQQYKNADIILFAPSWGTNDLTILPEMIKIILKDQKKVILVSQTPQSKVFGIKQINRFDKFVFENKRLPNEDELRIIETNLYNDSTGSRSTSQSLRKIAAQFPKQPVFVADRSDFMCLDAEKRCYFYFRNNNSKVIYDYGHTTTKGAQVLGRLINERAWLADVLKQLKEY